MKYELHKCERRKTKVKCVSCVLCKMVRRIHMWQSYERRFIICGSLLTKVKHSRSQIRAPAHSLWLNQKVDFQPPSFGIWAFIKRNIPVIQQHWKPPWGLAKRENCWCDKHCDRIKIGSRSTFSKYTLILGKMPQGQISWRVAYSLLGSVIPYNVLTTSEKTCNYTTIHSRRTGWQQRFNLST